MILFQSSKRDIFQKEKKMHMSKIKFDTVVLAGVVETLGLFPALMIGNPVGRIYFVFWVVDFIGVPVVSELSGVDFKEIGKGRTKQYIDTNKTLIATMPCGEPKPAQFKDVGLKTKNHTSITLRGRTDSAGNISFKLSREQLKIVEEGTTNIYVGGLAAFLPIPQRGIPSLVCEGTLQDEDGDGILEGGIEKITLFVNIKNKGFGRAQNVRISVKPEDTSGKIDFTPSKTIGNIPGISESTVSLEFSASKNVEERLNRWEVKVLEEQGFDCDPLRVEFKSKPLYLPEFKISEAYELKEQVIKIGEETGFVVFVENTGKGKAQNVQVEISSNLPRDQFIVIGDRKKNIGDLKPGQWKRVDFSWVVTKRFRGEKINFQVSVSEKKVGVSREFPIEVAIGGYVPKIEEVPIIIKKEKEEEATAEVPYIIGKSDVDEYLRGLPEPSEYDRSKWGVIIGIENYKKTPPVSFAISDALAIKEAFRKILRIPKENLIEMINDEATLSEIRINLEDLLKSSVKEGDTVYFYFSGHGVPDVRTGEIFILPYDGDTRNPEISSYKVSTLYQILDSLKAATVFVFLDSCFSGSVRGEERMLLAEARPGILKVVDPVLASKKLVVITAARGNQIANSSKEKTHGLFTYYFLKSLKEGKKTTDEVFSYLSEEVKAETRLLGTARYQEPVMRPEGVKKIIW